MVTVFDGGGASEAGGDEMGPMGGWLAAGEGRGGAVGSRTGGGKSVVFRPEEMAQVEVEVVR